MDIIICMLFIDIILYISFKALHASYSIYLYAFLLMHLIQLCTFFTIVGNALQTPL